MKQYIKSALWMLLGAAVMLMLTKAGSALACGAWAGIAFWACLIALLAAYGQSVVRMLKDAREEAPDIAGDREEAVRRQEELVRDPLPEKRLIGRMERGIWLRWSGMIAVNALMALFAGMSFVGAAGLFCAASGMFSLAPLMAFGFCRPRMVAPAKGTELCAAEYPGLFGLVRITAREAGHGRRIRIFLGEQGIGVFRARKYDGMLLPSLLAGFLTKSELRQVLRHEFSHLTCEDTEDEYRYLTLIERMNEAMDACAFCFFGLIVLIPQMNAFKERVTRYRALIENQLETEADPRGLPPEEARDAVAAIAKAAMFIRFGEEDRVSAYRCFESETPRRDQADIRSRIFESMLAERGKIWLEELESEQTAQFDSHPSFSQRRRLYGVTEFDAFDQEPDAAWRAEMGRLRAQENAYLAGNPDYEQMRIQQYVNRRAAMEAYERCAEPLEELDARAVVDAAEAYFGLNTPEALRILRSLLEKDPRNTEAKLLLGIWLLDNRDDSGLELLYQAAGNGNYTGRALQEAGNYVFRRGRSGQIAEYRQRSAELLQYAAEFHYMLDGISMKALRERTLPDAQLEELIAQMVRAGEGSIRAIACAAKDFRPGEDAHVFVIEYEEDDNDLRSRTDVRIFDMLDRRDEHYAVKDDEAFPIRKLEKQIPGCVVYKKSGGKCRT